MSNSYKKTPIAGHCGGPGSSEKFYKRVHSHQERSAVRQALAHGNYDINYQLILWDEWGGTRRDGKSYFGYMENEDKAWFKKLLRK